MAYYFLRHFWNILFWLLVSLIHQDCCSHRYKAYESVKKNNHSLKFPNLVGKKNYMVSSSRSVKHYLLVVINWHVSAITLSFFFPFGLCALWVHTGCVAVPTALGLNVVMESSIRKYNGNIHGGRMGMELESYLRRIRWFRTWSLKWKISQGWIWVA